MPCIWIDRRERRYRAHQHRHGMRVVAETLHELLRGFVEQGVVRDVMYPTFQFACGGQFAKQNQVTNLEIGAALSANIDRIPAIAKDSAIAIDIGDRASAGSG